MDDLTKKLAAEYDLAILYRDCEDFSRPTDREKYRQIRSRYSKLEKDQTQVYERDYGKRLTMAGRRIAEEKGLNFDKLIKAKDALSKRRTKLLKRLAHRDIQSDHLRRVAVVRNRMAQELSDLRDTVRLREAGQETPQQSPKLLTDGRSDAERITLRPKH